MQTGLIIGERAVLSGGILALGGIALHAPATASLGGWVAAAGLGLGLALTALAAWWRRVQGSGIRPSVPGNLK